MGREGGLTKEGISLCLLGVDFQMSLMALSVRNNRARIFIMWLQFPSIFHDTGLNYSHFNEENQETKSDGTMVWLYIS